MSTPSYTTGKAAIGYVVALGGIALFLVGARDDVRPLTYGGGLLIIISAIYITRCQILTSVASSDAGTRAQLAAITAAEAQLTAQRVQFDADMAACRREQAQEVVQAQQRLGGLARLLAETQHALEEERAAKEAVIAQLEDLNTEHNRLIQEVMAAQTAQFFGTRKVDLGRRIVPPQGGCAPVSDLQEHTRPS